MPSFNIVKKSDIEETFRVSKVIADYDVKIEHTNENFVGTMEMPTKWSIGVIIGNSGTGKSTIAKNVFGDNYIRGYNYTAKSIIDDMPKNCTVEDIEKMFYAVGFGSVPSWLKPYAVLSTGEKMRVDLARALLQNDIVVFDEFTSVVDRTVAQTLCFAISKSIKKQNKQFVAVSCHKDIVEWLQSDWVFDTETMKTVFPLAHGVNKNITSAAVGENNGRNLGVITI